MKLFKVIDRNYKEIYFEFPDELFANPSRIHPEWTAFINKCYNNGMDVPFEIPVKPYTEIDELIPKDLSVDECRRVISVATALHVNTKPAITFSRDDIGLYVTIAKDKKALAKNYVPIQLAFLWADNQSIKVLNNSAMMLKECHGIEYCITPVRPFEIVEKRN